MQDDPEIEVHAEDEPETDPRPLETAVMKAISDVQIRLERLARVVGRPEGVMQPQNRADALRELFAAGHMLSDLARVLRGSGTYFLKGASVPTDRKPGG